MAKIVNSNEFRDLSKEGIVVVDFFANWCNPCKELGPVFDEISGEMEGKAQFVKIDVDQSGDIAGENKIMAIPTIIVLKDGEKVETMTGSLNKESIRSNIERHL
ncbi:MAG: thioredoxin [Clostridium sp.]